ncbi:MAG: hypothetical protein HXX13_04085 [Bacteroidetes bacterium]|nr:hypothetical protein [Bacteroidota bacterium]
MQKKPPGQEPLPSGGLLGKMGDSQVPGDSLVLFGKLRLKSITTCKAMNNVYLR